MLGFNFGGKKILGVDIGASALKIVELELRSGRPYLSNYAWMPIPNILNGNDENSHFLETAAPFYLKKIKKEAGFSSKDAYISIPSFGGLITLIDFPAMPLNELEQAVKFEAHKYIPTSMDDVVTSWEIVGGNRIEKNSSKKNGPKKYEGNTQVILVAASKSKIMKYEKIAKEAGLKLLGVEMENLSIATSLVGKDEGNFIIVDIGFKICNMIYVEKGIIKANRNIDAGGIDITKTIAVGLNIAQERAENIKISGKNFFEAESSLHFSVLDMVIGEVSRIMNSLSKDKNSSGIDAIILSGGTAKLFGLCEFFQKRLNVKTIIGNPFSRVDYDKKLEPMIEDMKSHFSVSVGLALKGIENILSKK